MKARAAVTPIVLVVLATGAAAYAYLVDRGTVSDADRAARKRDVFPSFRIDEVTHVELTHDKETMALDRDAEAGAVEWVMTSPRHERADPGAVDALLRELEAATRVRDVTEADKAGFDPPRARGRVVLGALEYRFALGADAPRPEGAAYVRVDGEGTFVVERPLAVQLLRGADAYRDRKLLTLGESELARIEVTSPRTGGFVLEREGTTFRLGHEGLRASREIVEHLLANLTEARAESFLDDAVADRLLGSDAALVFLTPAAGKPPVQLRVGGQCPTEAEDVVVVRLAPTRVSACAAKPLADALGLSAAALVDTSPFFAHADEMEDLRLEPIGAPGPSVDIARRSTGWRERVPEDRDLGADESDSANALAAALADARGTDVRREASSAGFAPVSRVTATRTGSTTTETVEVGARDGETVLLRRTEDGAVLRVSRTVARRFQPHPVALRGRSLWTPTIDTGGVAAIDDTCGPTKQRVELRDGSWLLRSPSGFSADSMAPSDLASAMVHAKADAWISESDDGSFGLADPGSCTVTLSFSPTTDGQAKRAGIVFGAVAAGGFYARVMDDPAVFVASEVLRDLASHPMIDRGRFRVDPCQLGSVSVVRAGVRHAVACDTDAQDTLAAALAGLYAEAALHTGPPVRDEGIDHPTLEVFATARADAGGMETHVILGAPTRVDGIDGYFARAAGVDATFLVPKHAVDAALTAP